MQTIQGTERADLEAAAQKFVSLVLENKQKARNYFANKLNEEEKCYVRDNYLRYLKAASFSA